MSYPPGPPSEDQPTPENPYPGGPAQPGPPYGAPGYPPQPGYGQSPYGQLPATNGKATASLITGIATLVFSLCCLGFLGVIAIVLGVKARKEIRLSAGAQSGDGLALGGIVTGAVAVLASTLLVVIVLVAIASGNAEYQFGTNGGAFSAP